ncbi:MAG: ATP-dependent DNA ligase, partial [Pseudomonadota bacterium]
MQRFTELYRTLDQTTSTNAKVAAMVEYFEAAPGADQAWAVYFLSGRRLRRLVGASLLRQWLAESSELPEWLVEQTYASVGDLAETIALLLADRVVPDPFASRGLADFVEGDLLTLRALEDDDARRARVTGWWQTLPYDACYLVN